jgi:DoxX-like family
MQAGTESVQVSEQTAASKPSAKANSKMKTWTGGAMSALVIAFLLFDGAIKMVPLDIVITTSEQLGIPGELARLLGTLTLLSTILYMIPQTSVLGAILLTGYLGGAIAIHVRVGSPLFSHTLFGVYLGLLVWGGLYLRDERVRALIPFRR